MTAPTITVTLGPWSTMVRQLFAWVLAMHTSKRAAAAALGVPSSTVNTWSRQGVPLGVRGVARRTPGFSWSREHSALMGPGFAMVRRDRESLVIETEAGAYVEVPISAVLEVLDRDPPRAVTTGAIP